MKQTLTDSDCELKLQLLFSNLFLLLLFLVDFLILLMTISASELRDFTFTPLEEFPAELPGELGAFLTLSGDARNAWKALWYADIERKVLSKGS